MRKVFRRATVTPLLVAALVVGLGAPRVAARPVADRPVGAGYFFCAMGQFVKYYGLFTGNAPLLVAGAIGGGIACGMGW